MSSPARSKPDTAPPARSQEIGERPNVGGGGDLLTGEILGNHTGKALKIQNTEVDINGHSLFQTLCLGLGNIAGKSNE